MVDLEPFNEVMHQNIIKIVALGAVIIIANLLFKKLEKKIKEKKRRY